MGSVAVHVDEIGVPIGQKERPNRLSIGVQETKGCSTFHPRQVRIVALTTTIRENSSLSNDCLIV